MEIYDDNDLYNRSRLLVKKDENSWAFDLTKHIHTQLAITHILLNFVFSTFCCLLTWLDLTLTWKEIHDEGYE